MKLMYLGLKENQSTMVTYISICFSMIELVKENQGTMVTYIFICFSMIELVCYVWCLSYGLICNYFGWNDTSVL